MPILCLSQSFVTIAPIHHPLEEAGGIHRGGAMCMAYQNTSPSLIGWWGGGQNQDIGRKELCALGDVRHHDSHQSCCLCP